MSLISKKNSLPCPNSNLYDIHDFSDERGSISTLKEIGSPALPIVVRDSYVAKSNYGVFRGLHVQANSRSSIKIVRVLQGSVSAFSICHDLECVSRGEISCFLLSENEPTALLIPKNQAFGYFADSQNAQLLMYADKPYSASSELGISPYSLVKLGLLPKDILVSPKDLNFPIVNSIFLKNSK